MPSLLNRKAIHLADDDVPRRHNICHGVDILLGRDTVCLHYVRTLDEDVLSVPYRSFSLFIVIRYTSILDALRERK